MRGSRGLRMALVLLSLSLLLGSATPARAEDWYKAYDEGLRLLQEGDAAAAITAFQAALANRKKPGKRARSHGMHFVKYFPHLKLGEAYIQLEQWPNARRELEASLDARAAPESEVRRLLSLVEKLEAALASGPAATGAQLTAPTGFHLETGGAGGRYVLGWEKVAGAESYLVQERTPGVEWPAEGGQTVTGETVTIEGQPKGEFRHRVRAESSAAGLSPWSNELTVIVNVSAEEFQTAQARYTSGRQLMMQQGQLQRAATVLEEAVALVEGQTEWLALLGRCHANLYFIKGSRRELDKARHWFRLALQADPDYRLDPARVSPKIVELFEAERSSR